MRVRNRILLAILLTCPFLAAGQGYVFINEIMADNGSTFANSAGNFSDWVELYNPTDTQVDLGGWMLGKGAITNVDGYIFRGGTIVSPNGFLLVWLDKDTNSAGIHAGFALDKGGDQVWLRDAMGIIMNADKPNGNRIGFGLQVTDISIGRVPDGNTNANLTLTVPTPLGLGVTPANQAAVQDPPWFLKINEWCPTNNTCPGSHCSNDWFEIYNSGANAIAMGGLWLTTKVGGVPNLLDSTCISNLSFIVGGGYIRFWAVKKTKNLDANETSFGLSHNSGETLTLYMPDGVIPIDVVTFPGTAQISWVVNMSQGRLPDGDTNYMIFPPGKSTPGDSNFLPLTNVVVMEVLAHTDQPLQDAVKLYNPSSNDVDISRFWLSNAKNDPKKFRIPYNSIIPALGYKVFYEYQFNPDWSGVDRSFTFNSARGDGCYIFSADTTSAGTLTGYRRGVDFDSSENGVSFGRYVNTDGDTDMAPLSRLSFGSTVLRSDPPTSYYSNLFVSGFGTDNYYPLVGPVVITEIMYHPPDYPNGTDNSIDEFVELYNMSSNPVKLYDTNTYEGAFTNRWNLHSDIDFTLPYGLVLPPGQFLLLVNFDPLEPTNATQVAAFRTLYKIPTTFTNMYGPYKGKLKNSGGTIAWYKTDERQSHGDIGYVPQILVDRVKYNDKYPWPTNIAGIGPDGGGMALQRLLPEAYGNEPTNWCAVTASPGWHCARFESITHSNNTLTLTFRGWAQASYTIQRTDQLLGENGASSTWTKVADVPARSTTGLRQVTDVTTSGSTRFYRIVNPMQ